MRVLGRNTIMPLTRGLDRLGTLKRAIIYQRGGSHQRLEIRASVSTAHALARAALVPPSQSASTFTFRGAA